MDEAVRMYQDGASLNEIRSACGVPSVSLYRELKKRGVSLRGPRRRKKPLDRHMAMMASWTAGESLASLARRHGISRQRVHALVRKAKEACDVGCR
jgi:lambda repressor-like predicted transcriptional regulator